MSSSFLLVAVVVCFALVGAQTVTQEVVCRSDGLQPRVCNLRLPEGAEVRGVRLLTQRSVRECIEGVSYYLDEETEIFTTTEGCRGIFEVTFLPLPVTIPVQPVECSPGYYSSGDDCYECPAGTYQPNAGQDGCIDCPAGTETDGVGHDSSADCIYDMKTCQDGSFASVSCTGSDVIEFVYANYGRTDGVTCPHSSMSDQNCISTPYVIIYNCEGQNSCAIKVNFETMGGDPCYGTYKYLHLQWRCVPPPIKSTCPSGTYSDGSDNCINCPNGMVTDGDGQDSLSDCYYETKTCQDGSIAAPSCAGSDVIDFVYFNYGRTDGVTCPHASMSDQSCYSTPYIITDNCEGQNSCSISVGKEAIGYDPCYGTYKYLHLKWRCVSP